MVCIKIAVAKGRIANKTIEIMKASGFEFNDYYSNSRKLIFEDRTSRVKLIMVKADDVPTYVEYGAVDAGIVGKDTIMESGADMYEIMDLGFGNCRFVLAALDGYKMRYDRKIKAATKYPRVARDYFNKRMEPVEIIKLNGSVELAPVVGLSDVIVDIVETGNTLKENGLAVLDEICSISTRFVVNKASFKTKSYDILEIAKSIGRNSNADSTGR